MSNNDNNIEKRSFEAFVNAIGSEIEQAQVRLISAANAQMLFHYWKMGNYILYHQNRQGWGGKVIKKIIEDSQCSIDTEDDGKIYIKGTSTENIQKAIDMINLIVLDPEPGKTYEGTVTRLMTFGAFVEIAPGKEGLVHISKLAEKRTAKVEDVVNVGDKVRVKLLEIDAQGRLNLSIKDADK